MKNRLLTLLLALMLVFSLASPAFATQGDTGNNEEGTTEPTDPAVEEPTVTVITDFSKIRKYLSDPDFDLNSIDEATKEAWYKQVVTINDKTLKKAIKSAANLSSNDDITVADMLGLMGKLDLSNLGITSLNGLEYAINVTSLNLSGNTITSLEPIKNLYNLKKLDFSNNQIKIFASWLFELDSITYINASNNNTTVVSAPGVESPIKELYLEGNKITEMPNLDLCQKLQILSLANNSISEFPVAVAGLATLKNLSLSQNQIVEVPDLSELSSLQMLDISKNNIVSFPTGLNNLPSLSQLNLSGNRIKDIPETISETSIEILYMNQNDLETIPEAISSLTTLKILDIGINFIDLTNEANMSIINKLSQSLETFHYKIQIPKFSFEMYEFEDYPSGKLTWAGIEDVTDESEGSFVITKFVLERIEETLPDEPDSEDENAGSQGSGEVSSDNTGSDTNSGTNNPASSSDTDPSSATTPQATGTKPTINMYKQIAELDAATREYVDESAAPSTNYTYRLTAYAVCNYLGESSFEINITRTVNTKNMIATSIPKETIIKYIVIGLIALLVVAAVCVVLVKNSKSARRRKKAKAKKRAAQARRRNPNSGGNQERKIDSPRTTENRRPKSVSSQASRPELQKNRRTASNAKRIDDERMREPNKVHLEEKIDKYLKEGIQTDLKDKE